MTASHRGNRVRRRSRGRRPAFPLARRRMVAPASSAGTGHHPCESRSARPAARSRQGLSRSGIRRGAGDSAARSRHRTRARRRRTVTRATPAVGARARARFAGPVLLLDEPTAHLDAAARARGCCAPSSRRAMPVPTVLVVAHHEAVLDHRRSRRSDRRGGACPAMIRCSITVSTSFAPRSAASDWRSSSARSRSAVR